MMASSRFLKYLFWVVLPRMFYELLFCYCKVPLGSWPSSRSSRVQWCLWLGWRTLGNGSKACTGGSVSLSHNKKGLFTKRAQFYKKKKEIFQWRVIVIKMMIVSSPFVKCSNVFRVKKRDCNNKKMQRRWVNEKFGMCILVLILFIPPLDRTF